MKRPGSTSDFLATRNRELLQTLRRLIMTTDGIPMDGLYAMAAQSPCSRFWVSEKRAAEVISRMLRGEDMDVQGLPLRNKMYRELLRRVREWQAANPGHHLTDAVFAAVNSPAPEFYVTPQSAKVIISRIMQKRYKLDRMRSGIKN